MSINDSITIKRTIICDDEGKNMFERNTDRLIIVSLNLSCNSHEEHQLIRYLESNLPIVLKRRTECLSCEIQKIDNNDDVPIVVNVQFLLGLMENPRAIYGISHLLFLTIKKFQKIDVEIDGNRISSEITDEKLKKLIKSRYDALREEKERI